jgi:hypothetical protein
LSKETEALFRGELARRVNQPVVAEGYQVVVFEREAPLRSGEAVRLTRAEVKPSAVADVGDVYGDTAVPRLADTPGFCGTLLFADPTGGQLLSQTVWRDPHARAASPSVAAVTTNEIATASWRPSPHPGRSLRSCGSLFGAGAAALRNIKRYIRMRQM